MRGERGDEVLQELFAPPRFPGLPSSVCITGCWWPQERGGSLPQGLSLSSSSAESVLTKVPWANPAQNLQQVHRPGTPGNGPTAQHMQRTQDKTHYFQASPREAQGAGMGSPPMGQGGYAEGENI